MSILIKIKGVNMQTRCIDCPFMVSRENDDCILQSDEANERFKSWEQMKGGCPIGEEVIRCKDCKFRENDDFCTGRGFPYQIVPDDGFCDKGERL